MAGKFTKVLFAVELDGKPYGVELESDKLQQLLHHAAELSPDGKLSLSPMPNQQMFKEVMRKTPALPSDLADLIRSAQSHMLRTPEADKISVALSQYLNGQ